MDTIRVIGFDIAKSVFQVCVWMDDGSVAWNKTSHAPKSPKRVNVKYERFFNN